ncbi:MAG: hypothetical protein ABI114_01025 [Rhodanobacter sp.]
MNTIRDLGNDATLSPTVGDANASASVPIMTGAAPSNLGVSTSGQPAKGSGIGWLMMIVVFSCIAVVPFVIAAIVLLGR